MNRGLGYKIIIFIVLAVSMAFSIVIVAFAFALRPDARMQYLVMLFPYAAMFCINAVVAFMSLNLLLDIREELRQARLERG